jgi:serine-type D-Ala-D-Ala carboxypeptidase/endopeptidase
MLRATARPVPLRTLAILLAAGAALVAAPADAQGFPADSALRRIAGERLVTGRNPGIVIGVLDAAGARFFAAGTSGRDGLALDEHTAFEIGSITKVFTGIALASLAGSGEVGLDDPVARHLPAGVRVPGTDERPITLRHLATHTSGLPRLPSNLLPFDAADPYAGYTPERLYAFLADHTLRRPPGAAAEYSNVGAGLLGHALAHRTGGDYESLVTERVLGPLGLGDTWIRMTPEREARTAVGHRLDGAPVPYWTLNALEGAGALRSTARDLLLFAAANVDPRSSPISDALLLAQRVHAEGTAAGQRHGLGWGLLDVRGEGFLVHNGGTGGFRSLLALHPGSGRAVVILTNGGAPADDLGLHLLDPVRFPLPRR